MGTARRWLLAFMAAAWACNSDTNLWTATVPDSHWQSYDAQLTWGQALYDQGEYEQALTAAETAYALNPNSEKAAVLLGYVYLALAGLGPFDLIQELSGSEEGEEGEEGEEEVETASPAAAKQQEPAPKEDGLASLNAIIGLEAEEFALLGKRNTDIAELPIIEPVCADQARQLVAKLTYVNEAISVICSFVDHEVLIQEDERHRCQSNPSRRQHRAESHFLWALAHLVEALAFHAVLTYNTTGGSKSNLEQRVDRLTKIEVSSPSEIPSLVSSLNASAKIIERVLQSTGRCSELYPQTQLLALINDLMGVSYAFSRMPGLPPAMTEKINTALEKVSAIRSKSSEVAGSQQKVEAMKGDMTKKMAEGISKAISQVDASSYSPEQVTAVCASYQSIAGAQDKDKLPELCR